MSNIRGQGPATPAAAGGRAVATAYVALTIAGTALPDYRLMRAGGALS